MIENLLSSSSSGERAYPADIGSRSGKKLHKSTSGSVFLQPSGKRLKIDKDIVNLTNVRVAATDSVTAGLPAWDSLMEHERIATSAF